MVVLIALVGLVAGNLLNVVIARQLVSAYRVRLPRRKGPPDWVPLLGAWRRRAWLELAVEVVTGLMAAALFLHYGLSVRTLVLFGASLVLIDTGAIDFKVRMIDTLVLVVAIVAVLALAPLNAIGWLSSAFGLVMATIMFFLLYMLAKVLFPGVAAPFGLGDVYLAAFIGALVGFRDLSVALFYGIAMAGLVSIVLIALRSTGRKGPKYIAYGTYLCLGTLLFLATRTY